MIDHVLDNSSTMSVPRGHLGGVGKVEAGGIHGYSTEAYNNAEKDALRFISTLTLYCDKLMEESVNSTHVCNPPNREDNRSVDLVITMETEVKNMLSKVISEQASSDKKMEHCMPVLDSRLYVKAKAVECDKIIPMLQHGSPDHFIDHLRSVHRRKKEIESQMCHDKFMTYKSPSDHVKVRKGMKYVGKKSIVRKTHGGIHKIVPNEERSFACRNCHKKFKNHNNLYAHKLTHSLKKEYACQICFKKFKTSNNLCSHRLSHRTERPFACQICQKKFKTTRGVREHQAVHSLARPFECEVCKGKFKRPGDLRSHKRVHSELVSSTGRPSNPLFCQICQKQFKTPSGVRLHQVIHSAERPFKCQVCQRSFKRSGDLRSHKTIHSELVPSTGRPSKPFVCQICEKRFKTTRRVRLHQVVHSAERPFKCQFCPGRFKRSGDLRFHKTVHSELVPSTGRPSKPFVCQICEKRFKTTRSVHLHQVVHSAERPFKCQVCPGRFKRSGDLRCHEKVHSKGELRVLCSRKTVH